MRNKMVYLMFLATASVANVCSASSQTPTLDRIKSTKIINVGVRESASPFAVFDVKNKVGKGYTVDICNDIIEGLEKSLSQKLSVNYVSVTSANRIELVKSGKVDMECGSTTVTAEREKAVNFSYPVFVSGVRIAVRKDAIFTDYRHMGGAKVGIVKGSLAEKMVNEQLKSLEARGQTFTVHQVGDIEDGVMALATKKIDAFATDDVLLAGAISLHSLDLALKRVGPLMSVEPYAIMMSKEDNKFTKLVDELLAAQLTNGIARKTYSKWFDTSDLQYKMNQMTVSTFNYPSKIASFP